MWSIWKCDSDTNAKHTKFMCIVIYFCFFFSSFWEILYICYMHDTHCAIYVYKNRDRKRSYTCATCIVLCKLKRNKKKAKRRKNNSFYEPSKCNWNKKFSHTQSALWKRNVVFTWKWKMRERSFDWFLVRLRIISFHICVCVSSSMCLWIFGMREWKTTTTTHEKLMKLKWKWISFFFVPSRLSLYFMFYINHYIPLILFYYLLQIFVKKCKKEYFLSIAFVIFLCVNWSNFASFAFLGRILFVTVFCYLFNDFKD